MNIENLECFIEVASCGNFTKAADQMFLAQSTASRRVRKLEEELGTTLIARDAPTFRLTREGRIVFNEGRRILEGIASLEARVHDQGQDARGTVRVGFYGLLQHLDIAHKLQKTLAQSHPQMKLLTFYDKISRLDDDAKKGKADMFVSLLCELPKHGFARRMLYERHTIALVPRGHRLADRVRIDVNDLRDEPLIFWKRDAVPGFYASLVEQCEQAGFQPRFSELHDLEDMIVMSVSNGNGITILFDKTSVSMGEGVAQVPIDNLHIPVDVAYAYAENRLNAGIAAVSQAFEALRKEEFAHIGS